jgi:uncharacterized membrane protein
VFEFFFKYPPTVFRKGDFVFSSGWPEWLLALLVIAAGAGLWWHVRRHHGRLEGRRLWAVWALQFAAAALILLLLWQPAIGIRSLRAQQNVVSVLVDTSRSMALGEGEQTRLEQARAALGAGVLDQLGERFRVRLYSFSGQIDRLASLDQAPPPGNATRIGDAVAGVLRESAALPLGAVVVVSDGSDNSGGFDRRVMAEIRQSNVPVHTVGVGRTEIPEDTELADVVVAPRALPNSRLNAQLTIRHSGVEQKETRVSVRDGSRILASKAITLRRGEPVQTEFVDFSAGEPGIRNLLFVLEPLPGEHIAGNNSLARVVDVPRKRRRILYVEGEPRWDYKFVRRAVDHDPSVQLVTMLRTSPNKFYRQGVDHPEELEDGFPVKAEELFEYDALMLGSIEAAYFTPEQQEMIKEFVNRRGGTLLLLGGRRGLADGGWGTSKVAEVLPAALAAGDANTFVREKAAVELTVQGADSLICRFDEDPEKNAQLWKEMPALADYQRVGELKPAAVQLLAFRLGGETQPLLVLQNYGRGRALILASGGTWRWKMGLPHDDTRHHTFWQQLLRSLVANSPGTVTISSDQTLYADRSDVALRAEVRTKEYQPANNATVTAVVTPETGPPLTVELSPSAEEPGVYESSLTAAAPGAYRVEVSAFVADQALGSEAFHFRRQDGVAEDFRPAQNRELLTKLAEQTGGRYWTLDELAALPEEIRYSEAGVTAREIMDLWDMPFFFLLLLTLRAAEWLLRRRWGVV